MKDALLIILNWYSYFFDGADPELISIAKEKENKGDTTCTFIVEKILLSHVERNAR